MLNEQILKTISQRKFTLLSAFVFSILCLNWSVPVNFEADTILQSLMSTQKVTLFYWGQDRYANFLPFIYSWIKTPTLNLLLIIFTSGLAFFLLLELVSDAITKYYKQNNGVYRTLLFISLVLVSILILNKKGIYVFAYAAQPYSLSFLFLGWAWAVVSQKQINLSSVLAATLMLFVALGINPSIILSCAVSSLFFYACKRNRNYLLVPFFSLIFFGFWQYVSKSAFARPEGYSQLNPELVFKGLIGSLKHFADNTETLSLTVVLLVATIILNIINFKNVARFKANLLVVVMGAFAVAWWVTFSMSVYVSRNDFHFRYFFPTILALLVLISLTITDALLALKQRACLLAVGAALTVIFIIIVVPYKPVAYWHSSGVFDGVGQYARAANARIITGGYWQVWPALFRFQSTDNRQDAEGKPWLYGATTRGEVNRPEMDSLIVREARHGRSTTAVCIGARPEQCLRELAVNTSFNWQFIEEGKCLTMTCYLFQVKKIE